MAMKAERREELFYTVLFSTVPFLQCAFSPECIFYSVPFLQCVTFGGTEEGEPKKQKGKGLPTDIRPLAHQPTREHSQNMI